jgi:hypothetical protein
MNNIFSMYIRCLFQDRPVWVCRRMYMDAVLRNFLFLIQGETRVLIRSVCRHHLHLRGGILNYIYCSCIRIIRVRVIEGIVNYFNCLLMFYVACIYFLIVSIL